MSEKKSLPSWLWMAIVVIFVIWVLYALLSGG
jgi:hypothetical protein